MTTSIEVTPEDLYAVLSDRERVSLDQVLSEGYSLEQWRSGSGKVRGIVRGYRTVVSKVKPNPWNPNVMNDRTQEAVSESLAEYGQIVEVVVRPHPEESGVWQICDGEHRSKSIHDAIAINILFGYSEAELKKLTLVLNETKGRADRIEMAKLLKSIEQDFGDALGDALPYSDNEMGDILKLANLDWDSDLNMTGGEEPAPKANDDDGWVNLKVSIPRDVNTLLEMAIDAVRQDRKNLHKTQAIALGQVLEVMVVEYLNGVQQD